MSLGPDSVLGEFTKANESPLSETMNNRDQLYGFKICFILSEAKDVIMIMHT